MSKAPKRDLPSSLLKLSVVGEQGAGKSSFMANLICSYRPYYGTPDIENLELSYRFGISTEDKEYVIDIWEQTEDEQQYLQRAHLSSIGWIMVFDLTTITSVEGLEEYYNRYYDIIVSGRNFRTDDGKAFTEKIILSDLMLIGTKADLAPNNRLPKSVIEEFARSKSVPYIETPLQSNNEELQKTFEAMLDSALKGTIKQEINSSYEKMEERLRLTKKKRTRCVVM